MKTRIVVAVMSLALVIVGSGCGDPTIDASSEQAFKASIEEVGNSIDDAAKKEKFEEAVATLSLQNVVWSPGDEKESQNKLMETFDGKTAEEVIADGEKAKAAAQAEIDKMMQQ